MNAIPQAPRVLAHAQETLLQSTLLANPYIQAVAEGTLSREDFRKTQEQFGHAVYFFSRPMAALVGRIPDPQSRIDILANLVEEHGNFSEKAFHHTTFQHFLTTIGSQPDHFQSLIIWPELRAFNSVLMNACVLDEMEVGVACMGIIELAFGELSARIGRAVVARKWLKEEELVHYKLHEEIDARHAEELFAVVEPLWEIPSRRYYIEQGLKMGVYVFNRLYEDLWKVAQNPHFRSS